MTSATIRTIKTPSFITFLHRTTMSDLPDKSVPNSHEKDKIDDREVALSKSRNAGHHYQLRSLLPAGVMALIFTAAINFFSLTLPMYSMQIFERVIPASSLATLVMLTGIVIVTLLFSAVIEAARASLFIRIATRTERVLSAKTLANTSPSIDDMQRMTYCIDVICVFVRGPVIAALADTPFAMFALVALYFLHPNFAVMSVAGLCVLALLAVLGHLVSAGSKHEAALEGKRARSLLLSWRTNQRTALAMGFMEQIRELFESRRRRSLTLGNLANERAARVEAMIRGTRSVLQILLLALAAYLVIARSVGPGAMVAASMLFTRLLGPIERVLGSLTYLQEVRSAANRISAFLKESNVRRERFRLPALKGEIAVSGVTVLGRTGEVLLSEIDFRVDPGDLTIIVGPEGAGKSTLMHVLLGVLRPTIGDVRYDGAKIDDFDPTVFGAQVGYLADDDEALQGQVAEIVSRGINGASASVIEATSAAGVHQFILGLPEGYETVLGPSGRLLSAGQRRRIALARAIYGWPRILVLDEPIAHLDDEGEGIVLEILGRFIELGATVFVVTRAYRFLHLADRLLFLDAGILKSCRSHDEVREFLRMRLVAASPGTGSYSPR